MRETSVNFAWHDHHFITGVAGLDFANTIVWRDKHERRQDRIRTIDDVKGWAVAAGLPAPRRETVERFLAIRTAIDNHFRPLALGAPRAEDWSRLVSLYGVEAAKMEIAPSTDGLALASLASLEAILLHSAVALAFSPLVKRVKVCGNCGWLFVDRTRNGNKRWCIAAMCGSRVKARRHYARKRNGNAA